MRQNCVKGIIIYPMQRDKYQAFLDAVPFKSRCETYYLKHYLKLINIIWWCYVDDVKQTLYSLRYMIYFMIYFMIYIYKYIIYILWYIYILRYMIYSFSLCSFYCFRNVRHQTNTYFNVYLITCSINFTSFQLASQRMEFSMESIISGHPCT